MEGWACELTCGADGALQPMGQKEAWTKRGAGAPHPACDGAGLLASGAPSLSSESPVGAHAGIWHAVAVK